ncbi:MAG: flippase-like domain-containing protein, partial [Candidatus Hydrogenedentes bacterium]|nr:flippase-like domain-containing protein [Candidatus Hydrogenedentota bacterium]
MTVGLFVLLFRPQTFGLPADYFGAITPGKLLAELRQVEAKHIAFWLLFATIVKLLGMLAGVLRWRLLLHGQGLRMPFWYMVQSWFIGRTIGIFLPGTIGLDGYRLYDSARYTGEVVKSTTVIAVEKLIGIIAMTLLVFLTFPLGYRLLNFNLPLLVISMTAFGGLVVVSLLTLLNPRVIQVLVAVVPTPARARRILNKLGDAATAYSGNRRSLLLAVFFGVLVHVGTCLMYFGTMSAIRAENTTIADIFFTSPLMIWGTVVGPTVGGEGVREFVFIAVLGAKSGELKAFLIAHLGWWVGELVPFLIGLPIFLLRKRPAKEELSAEVAAAREASARAQSAIALSPQEVRGYRQKLLDCGLAGVLAGLIAGALVGLGEA